MSQFDESKPNYDVPGTDVAQNIVWVARMQKGKPYTFAQPPRTQKVLDKVVGKGVANGSPDTFDCSGLVWFAVSIGDSLGEIGAFEGKDGTKFHPGAYKNTYADTQMKTGLTPITVDQLQIGDFCGSELVGGIYGHIAIYSGEKSIIEAPHTGANVRERPFVASEWQGYARLEGLETPDQIRANQDAENVGDSSLHGNPIDDVKKLVEGIANVFKAINTAIGHLLKPEFWRKVGLLFGGAILLLVAANELQKGLT